MAMSRATAMSLRWRSITSTMLQPQLLLSKAEVDADAAPKSNTLTIPVAADAASRINRGLSCLQAWGTTTQCRKKRLIHLQK